LHDVAELFDSVAVYETVGGRRLRLVKPSLIDTLTSWRSFQDEVSMEVLSVVSLHDIDHNEDWVSTWTMNRWTTKTGGKDSILANENWKFVNGKIAHSTAYEARPAQK